MQFIDVLFGLSNEWINHAGLGNIFHLRHRLAILILLPILYGNALVSLYGFAKLVGAMAESKLVPKILARKYWRTKTNIFALLLACIISIFAIAILSSISDHLFVTWSFVMNFFAFFTYIVQLIGYCILQVKLCEIPRDYESPFGLWGAIFAICVFLLAIASTLAGKVRVVVTFEVAAVCFGILTLYYYFYAMQAQTFSEAERKVMLPAHVHIRNANGKMLFEWKRVHGNCVQNVFYSPVWFQNICTPNIQFLGSLYRAAIRTVNESSLRKKSMRVLPRTPWVLEVFPGPFVVIVFATRPYPLTTAAVLPLLFRSQCGKSERTTIMLKTTKLFQLTTTAAVHHHGCRQKRAVK